MLEKSYRRPEGRPRVRWEDKFITFLTETQYRGADNTHGFGKDALADYCKGHTDSGTSWIDDQLHIYSEYFPQILLTSPTKHWAIFNAGNIKISTH